MTPEELELLQAAIDRYPRAVVMEGTEEYASLVEKGFILHRPENRNRLHFFSIPNRVFNTQAELEYFTENTLPAINRYHAKRRKL